MSFKRTCDICNKLINGDACYSVYFTLTEWPAGEGPEEIEKFKLDFCWDCFKKKEEHFVKITEFMRNCLRQKKEKH